MTNNILERRIKGVFSLWFTSLLLFAWSISSIAQTKTDGWNLTVEKDNIKVYTRTPANSAFKEIRIDAIFNAPLEKLTAALDDASSYTTWVYKCSKSKRVKTLNELEFYYYLESDLPFPLVNRDLVVHSSKWEEKEQNTVYYFSTSIDKVLPKEKDLVRITKYDSFWTIKELAKNKLSVEYQSRTDPAGNLPAWLVNLAVTTGPLKSMQQLEQYIKNK